MKVLVLDFQMFPDREMVERALAHLAAEHDLRRLATASAASEDEWDAVLAEIRHADLLVTL